MMMAEWRGGKREWQRRRREKYEIEARWNKNTTHTQPHEQNAEECELKSTYTLQDDKQPKNKINQMIHGNDTV